MIGVSKCPTCGKEFKWKRNTKNGAAKYCSNECRSKKSIDIAECEICGKTFESYRSPKVNRARFCSTICRFKSRYWIAFEWKNLSAEQKLERYKKCFEKLVIKKEGCWEWKGSKDRGGYGRIQFKRSLRAHRVSYLIHKGEIPKEMYVCHHCDNPSCTNPDHLFLGTPKDNTLDMIRKGRSKHNFPNPKKGRKGSLNGNAKLDEKKVAEIKRLLSIGVTGSRIARNLNITKSAVSKIKTGESWKHIK